MGVHLLLSRAAAHPVIVSPGTAASLSRDAPGRRGRDVDGSGRPGSGTATDRGQEPQDGEENALLATLGDRYRAYASHHKRLVPLVW